MLNTKLYEVYSKEIIDNLTPIIEDMERCNRHAVAILPKRYRDWTLPTFVCVEGRFRDYSGYVQNSLYKLLTEEMLNEDDYECPTAAPMSIAAGEVGIPLWVR